METHDHGQSWQTADGRPVPLPLAEENNPALVRDYRSEGLIVYLKDLNYDAAGRPIILYATSRGHASGPQNPPRELRTAHWTGREWLHRRVTSIDHNYDHGSLYVSPRNWRFIGPTAPGPQPHATGGEIAEWISSNQGQSWRQRRVLTSSSPFNHTYVRRPLHAHPDFESFWADGHAFRQSESHLYFANSRGEVFRLPPLMTAAAQRPLRLRARP